MQQLNDTNDINDILKKAVTEVNAASDLKSLDQHRVHYLGKKGLLTERLKQLGKLPPEERPAAGQKINEIKIAIHACIEKRSLELNDELIKEQLKSESIDITLPGRSKSFGSTHPVTKTFEELRDIFNRMGYIFLDGPEVEDDYHNFAALNIPPLHPSRAMADTFYSKDGMLLRTHMSPVQVRAMKAMQPPMRMVALGRVYRRDFDITHTPMFHQMECLVIDKDITFADLKGTLKSFLKSFFATDDIAMRLRPSYFPFTEPSAEVDIGCIRCHGNGCRICKNTGWLEVLGCGMVHPNVLREAGIDAETHQGFAFGVGIDRLTMLKYGITDLRSLFENDLRFLNQF